MKLLIIALSCGSVAAQCVGGPPDFKCSLKQTNAKLTVIPTPTKADVAAHLGSANSTFTPTPWGNEIWQCTDANTSTLNKLNSHEVTDSGGDGENQMNADQTLLRVVKMTTGATVIIPFDGVNHTCGKMLTGSTTAVGAMWHPTDPTVDFTLTLITKVSKRIFDPVNKRLVSVTPLFDYRTCPGLANLPNNAWNSAIGSADGDNMTVGFSDLPSQDTGHYVATYTISTGKCVVWDTLTGQVSGLGQISTFFPFTIHNVNVTPGNWVQVAVGNTCTGCPPLRGPFFWKNATTEANLITTFVGGHNTCGFHTYINIINAPATVQRPDCDLIFTKQISVADNVDFPLPAEAHLSWNNVDKLDTVPFMFIESSQRQPQPLTITSPLQNEIVLISPVTGLFIRVAPTLTSGITAPDGNFRAANAIGSIGKKSCIVWTSDGFGTFGNTNGTSKVCVLGANVPNRCQNQVLAVCPQ